MSARSALAARPRLLFVAVAALLLAGLFAARPFSDRDVDTRVAAVATAAGGSITAGQTKQPEAAVGAARAAHADHMSREQHAADRRRAKWLRSPAARHQRRTSRTRFRDLGPTEALATLVHHQPSIAERDPVIAPHLRSSERIVSYPSTDAALVERTGPNGKARRAMAQSVGVPIAVADPAHPQAPLKPIDLSLVDAGDGFRPARGSVSVKLPKLANLRANVGDAFTVGFTKSAAQATVIEGKKAFYPTIAPDTDAVLEPANTGLELSWILRSPAAPKSLPLDVTGIAGGAVTPSVERDGSASLNVDGGVIGGVAAPEAWDAQGTLVPTRLAVVNGQLTVEVSHTDRRYAYPIAVDPLIHPLGAAAAMVEAESATSYVDPDNQDNVIWSFTPTRFAWDHAPAWGVPPFWWSVPSDPYLGLSFGNSDSGAGWWFFDPVRQSSVFRAEFSHVRKDLGNGTLTVGIADKSGSFAQTLQSNVLYPGANGFMHYNNALAVTDVGLQSTFVQACAAATDCGWGGGRDNVAGFQLASWNRPHGQFGAYFDGGVIWHRETDAPRISAFSAPVPASGWINGTVNGSLSADDDGIGFCSEQGPGYYGGDSKVLHTIAVSGPGVAINLDQNGCYGATTYQPAPSHLDNVSFGSGTQQLPEGDTGVNVRVSDLFANYVDRWQSYRVDRSAPRANLGGRLAGFLTKRDSPTAPLPPEIKTQYGLSDLTIGIQDSKSGIPTSGVTTTGAVIKQLDPSTGNVTGTAISLFGSTPCAASGSCAAAPPCAGGDSCDRAAFRFDPGTASAPANVSSLAPGLYNSR